MDTRKLVTKPPPKFPHILPSPDRKRWNIKVGGSESSENCRSTPRSCLSELFVLEVDAVQEGASFAPTATFGACLSWDGLIEPLMVFKIETCLHAPLLMPLSLPLHTKGLKLLVYAVLSY